jgi:2'-5' RNA ligase
MLRLFAAVEIPIDIAEDLSRRQQGVPGARWRPLDSLHITLRFFGETSEPQAAELHAELNRVEGPPMELMLDGVGTFGQGGQLRAIWAGVADNPALRQLAGRCEAAARRAGFKPEPRPFQPHVTLAYLRRAEPQRVAAWIQGHNLLKSPPFRVTWFGLYSSWTTNEGSRYDLEREYALLQSTNGSGGIA